VLELIPLYLLALTARGATRAWAGVATAMILVDWLGIAQRPAAAAQILALAAVVACSFVVMGRGERATRADLVPFGAVLVLACLAIPLARAFPAPTWPDALPPRIARRPRRRERSLGGRTARRGAGRARAGLGRAARDFLGRASCSAQSSCWPGGDASPLRSRLERGVAELPEQERILVRTQRDRLRTPAADQPCPLRSPRATGSAFRWRSRTAAEAAIFAACHGSTARVVDPGREHHRRILRAFHDVLHALVA